MNKYLSGLLCVAILIVCSTNGDAAITFLHHFNDSQNFDINPANGDFAAGDSTATLSTTPPTSGAGFFTGNSTNGALRSTATGQFALFDGFGGNIQFTSPTEGGITFGFWYRFEPGTSSGGSQMAVLGTTSFDDDYATLDNSWGPGGIERGVFRDGSSQFTTEVFGQATASSEWNYLASTIDLTNQEMKLYRYEANGSLADSVWTESITVGGMIGEDGNNGWNLNVSPNSKIRILGGMWGGLGGVLLDEFSIDDRVLSPAEMDARVAYMVAGNELVGPVRNADFDGDGDVDGKDFLTWQRGFGTAGVATLSDGDANDDKDVNGIDLEIWQDQYGTDAPLSATAFAVPEPGSLSLLLLISVALCSRVRLL